MALSPEGHLYADDGEAPGLGSSTTDGGPELSRAATARLRAALDRGSGHAVLELGVSHVEAPLPATLGFFRDLGREVATAACAAGRAGDALPPTIDLDEWARRAPPMRGGETLDAERLGRLWADTARALSDEARATGGDASEALGGYLGARNPLWSMVGRVVFHLAENKRSPAHPFAFLATYTHGVAAVGGVRHVPLGRALRSRAGAEAREGLLALLAPVRRASEAVPLVAELVDSGEIFHPVALTPAQALAFLQAVPALEHAGVVVRSPPWWNARKRQRVEVTVQVGSKAPSGLGADALLDFSAELTLDGKRLTAKERREILAASGGLVLLRGRWVELDREHVVRALSRWQELERLSAAEGIAFSEAMRLLAGVPGADPGSPDGADPRAGSRVIAGPWLRKRLDALGDPKATASVRGLRAELRPYQRRGVAWLSTLHQLGLGGCLADDMGLGKTLQVLAVLLRLHGASRRGASARRPSLIVVPASLVGNWTAEIERFAPSLDVLVAHPSQIPSARLAKLSAASLGKHDVVITTYGTLHRVPALSRASWELAVLDEAQAIKNPSTKQARAAKKLDAVSRLALTGTPIENSLADLWSIYDYACPGLLGSAESFRSLTRGVDRDGGRGYAALRELVRPYLLRRLKTDRTVIDDLPEKTEVTAQCSLTRKQAALYGEAVSDLARDLRQVDGIKRRGVVLAALMRMKQICNHPSQWLRDGEWDPADSGKIARLAELVEPIAARQEKMLVFTQFRETTEPLARILAGLFGRPGLVLHGGTSVKKRRALVDQFQEELGPPFFVISLKAGGSGLNLTRASHVVHFDRWWNPAVEDQATDRAFRIGQRNNVLVHKLCCRGTVEERIDALIQGKRALADAIVGTAQELSLTELPNDEILRLVSLDIHAALGGD